MNITITPEQPDSADAAVLIAELDDLLAAFYPPADRHGYSVDKLKQQGVHFFVVRIDGASAGCGGIQLIEASPTDVAFGELKRMYVRPSFRGLGVGRKLLVHLAAFAQHRGVTVLRLETGIHQKEAIALYEHYGFRRIKPFGDYRETPVSLCYEKRFDS
jgi:putative acetyltransferase